MANEFVARKGLIVSGSSYVTGSMTASAGFFGSLTGSVLGTASFATSASLAVTSSFAVSASWAPGGSSVSASFATTASAATSITFTPATASFSTTASYALTSAGTITNAATASYLSGTVDFPNGLTTPGPITASQFCGTGSAIVGVISSSYALTASFALNGGGGGASSSYALSSSYTLVAQNVLGSITSASYAATASYIDGNINFPSGLVVTGSVTASAFSGSMEYSFLVGRPSNSVFNSNWGSGSDAIQQVFTVPNATVGQYVIITAVPPLNDPDEAEMDGIVGSGYVSAVNTVTAYLVASPGPIAGIRPINILIGV